MSGRGGSSLQAAAAGRGGGGGRGNNQQQQHHGGRSQYHQTIGAPGGAGRGMVPPGAGAGRGVGMWQPASGAPGAPTTAAAAALGGLASSMPPPPGGMPQGGMSGYPGPPPQHAYHPHGPPPPPPQYGMHAAQPMMMHGAGPGGAPMMYRGPPPQQAGRPAYGMYQAQSGQFQGGRYPMGGAQMGGMQRSAPPGSGGLLVGAPAGAAAAGTAVPAPSPRVAKALTITDKDGNVIDLSKKGSNSAPASGSGGVAEKKEEGDADEKGPSSLAAAAKNDAGAALRKAAEEAIAAGSAKKAREEAERKQREKEEEERRIEEERIAAEKKAEEERLAKIEAERLEKERKEREERERLAAEEAKARKEAEERARKEFEERQKKEAEEREARAKAEEEARARAAAAAKEREASVSPKKEAPILPKSGISPAPSSGGFRPGGFRPGGTRAAGLRPGSGGGRGIGAMSSTASSAPSEASSKGAENVSTNVGAGNGSARRPFIYSKQMLLSLRDEQYCVCRPEDLPDMTVKSGDGGRGGGRGMDRRQSSSRGGYGDRGGDRGDRRGGGGGGGDEWARGRDMPARQRDDRYNDRGGRGGGGRGGGGGEWDRGRAPPPARPGRGDRGGGPRRQSSRGQDPYMDDDLANYVPLVKTANRWMPSKDNSAMAKVEKQVKGMLNKITKEKFDKISGQMCDIPILSYEMLALVIKLVYEKAIGEPYLSDMYANLCYRLSQAAKKSTFIRIIESDEDPHAEPGAEVDYSQPSGCVSYRWSNDVSTSDAEVVGPFDDDKGCIAAALSDTEQEPIKRGDMELTLHKLVIQRGNFIKIMTSSDGKFYAVFFPVSKADECGQQMSLEIFTSEIEAQNHATKMNTFKRSLLNKCEDEFNKQDIYTDWKKEMSAYKKEKASLSEKERNEREEDLEFRRMKIKKQMLGNVKFIGELYKLSMLKEKIMRFCIHSLLKIEEYEGGLRSMSGEDGEMDEEDHEALCNLFKTIGKTIDNPKAQPYMKVYFKKISTLSDDKTLGSRSRFMYKDLIEMRTKGWKLRREVETAKTLDEIRKDAERDERKAQMESQQGGYGGGRGRGGRGGGRGGYDDRGRGGRGGGRGGYDRDGGRGGGRGGYDRDGGGRGGYDNRRDNRGYDNRDRGYDNRGGGRGGGGYDDRDRGYSSRGPPPGSRSVGSVSMGGRGILPPPAAGRSGGGGGGGGPPGQVFTPDKLKLRANNMRQEWIADPDEKELLMSIDEVLASPDASKIIVQTNIDYAADCKESELKSIIKMIDTLYRKKKVDKSDIESAMGDLVEFIDSFACDNPRIFDYVGEMFCAFANANALDVTWLCDCTSKVMDDSCKPKVIEGAMKSIHKQFGVGAVKGCFGDRSERSALEGLLGAAKVKELESQFS